MDPIVRQRILTILIVAIGSAFSFGQASISSINPSSGPVGTWVTIGGQGFGDTQGSSTVALNSTNAVVVSWSDSTVIAVVPTGAQSGAFSITVNGTAASSATFTVTSLPSGWSDADIGSTGVSGSSSYANGTLAIEGAGAAIAGTADAFHFVYQSLTGDGSIVARVTAFGSSLGQAGVMIRETLDAGGKDATVMYYPGYGCICSADRSASGGSSSITGSLGASLPYFVKVSRTGNVFTSFRSPDGVNWTQLGSTQTVTMAQSVYIGLAVASGSTTAAATATFDSVSISSSSVPAPVITGLSEFSGFAGDQVTITGTGFGASQPGSQVTLNGSPLVLNSWSDTSVEVTIPAAAATGFLVVGLPPSLNDSNPVRFTVLPHPWLDQDIGSVSTPGSASFMTNVFTVKGQGSISGTADSFHFVYQPVSGDATIIARVTSVQGIPQVGVMIRETLSASSSSAFVSFWSSSATFSTRTSTGASATSQSTSWSNSSNINYWLELVRSGNTFSAYISVDRSTWTQVGTTATIPMAQNAYIGLAVSSGGYVTAITTTLDDVSASAASAPAPDISNMSSTTGSVGTEVAIGGTGFGAAQGNSQVFLNGSLVTVNTWSDTLIVITIPSGATSGLFEVSVAPTMNDSNTAYFSVTSQPIPLPWLDKDIGAPESGGVLTPGSATFSGNAFTVKGLGGTLAANSTSDTFHFVYQTLSGDGSITAKVSNLGGSQTPEAGIMIRETLTQNSSYAFAWCWPGTTYFYTRVGTGTATTSQLAGNSSNPYWVRLVRGGNLFSAYISSDGLHWTQIGTTTSITMAQSVYIGLATVSSGTFDNVSISSSSVQPPAITSLSATTGSVGSQVVINGSGFGGAQNSSLVYLNGATVTVNTWSDTQLVVTVPTGATSGLFVVYLSPSMNASNPVYFAVTTHPLPIPWLDQDIGVLNPVGSATFSSGAFTISGTGGTLSPTASDTLHFMYQTLSGDGSITARFSNLGGAQIPEVGVMIRETLAQNSSYAFAWCWPGTTYFYTRAGTGTTTTTQLAGNSSNPYWARLIRDGSTFIAYISSDGTNWTQIGSSVTISMAQTVYIGLAAVANATVDNVSVIFGTTPYVSAVSPIEGALGTSVTITGSNFGDTQGSSTVLFNGVQATSISSWSTSQITAVVPSNAPGGPGPVSVVANSISSNTNVNFTVIRPAITSLTPPSAAPGGTVIVSGSGFLGTPGNSKITLNGQTLSSYAWSDSSVTIQVPSGATSGPVVVTVDGVDSNGVQLTVEGPPTISAISPPTGTVGSSVTIGGSGFGAAQSNSTIQFNGIAATVSSWSDTQIVAVVPPAAVTGPIIVTVAQLDAFGPDFTVTSTVAVTDSLGNVTNYTEAMLGGSWILTSSQGSGCSSCRYRGTISQTADANGNILTSTDELARVTTDTYDSSNNLTSVSQQLDANTTVKTSYTYNSFGEVLTATDPLGNVTTNAYDSKGNLLSVTTPKPDNNTTASVTQFGYDSKGELTSITDPLNNVTTLTYTPQGYIASITDAQQHTTTYGYDAHGNRTSVTDAMQNQTTFAYDTGDRLTTITYPGGSTVGFGYDTRGRRTSSTDQNSKVTTYAYDDADRLTSVTDAANNTTQYGYDTENNLTSITDANGHATSFQYNARGWVTQTTFPSTLAESYVYDAVGNLTSKTDRKNQIIQYFYDALNRLTQKNYPDSTGVEYVYDLVGKIKQVSDPTGTYGFAYDSMGRLIGTSTSYASLPNQTFTNSYTYDAASNRKTFTAPDGSSNTYTYDTLNRLSNVSNSWAGSFGFGYDALSRRTSLTRPNGVSTSYGYDSLSRLLSVLHQAGSTTLDGAGYTYDPAGNRSSKTNYINNITENYTYDAIYQLAQVTQGGSTTESYSYDPVGNRLSSLNIAQYNYNSSNQLTSNSLGSYTYDNNGNTLTDPSGRSFTWDFENRMASATVPATGAVNFQYDPFGRRIQKSSAAGTTNYVYDGASSVDEITSTGLFAAGYLQGAGIDEPLAMSRGGASTLYDADGLGTVTSMLNGSGGAVASYVYDTFGNATATAGSAANPFRYTGRELDSETGLYYYRARYYDPQVGRFLSEDPLVFRGGTDFYEYALNDPVKHIDPTGLIHQAWREPPHDGRLHDDADGGLEVLCTKGRNIQQDIQWLEHSIFVRTVEIEALGKDADAGHIDRLYNEELTLMHCYDECEKNKKPEPESHPFEVPKEWTDWLQDRWNEFKTAVKHPPQRQTPWGPVPVGPPIPVPVP